MLPRNAKDKKIFLIEKKMIDEKAIEQQAILLSHTIRFYSTRSDVMVVFSQRRHLRQILQLGTTRFNLSIKSDFLEFQSCREMHSREDYFWLARWFEQELVIYE